MIFQQLIIKNFRQFYGEQTIKFSINKNHNVTVIHGFNGSGKTTLLNVFTWLFYGIFTPDFENSDHLETEAAFAQIKPGENLVTLAQLIFEDKGKKYTAERKRVITKDNTGKRWMKEPEKLTLKYIDETGEVREPGNPKESLEQLLPTPLYPFFFFNGERIEKLASPDAYKEIESGVKVLLDIEVFERAINHLDGKVAKELREEIAKHAGDDGIKVRQAREEIEEEKKSINDEICQWHRNLKSFQAEKEKIDLRLNEMPELAKWQAEREAKERELETIQKQLKEYRGNLSRELSKHGYLVLVADALTKAKKILESAHTKGELPIPIKRQFVNELLEKGECICGRNLVVGEHSYFCVKEWRERVGSEELESAISVTKAKLESLFQRREAFIKEIAIIQQKRSELLDDRNRIQEELSELSSKIGNRKYGEDHAKLEEKRRDIETGITTLKINLKQNENLLKNIEEQLRAKDQEIKKLDKVDERGKLAQRRLEAISNVKSAIEKIRKVRHKQLSTDLSRRLGEVWSRIAVKDYQAKLDDQYHLILTKNVGGIEEPVRGASTGEKQVLSLAFIGSLVDKARSTYEEQGYKKALFQGGLYPLVIDSAFGQLEPEYKRDVAKWLPDLAPQVIVFVSESQWKQEVEEELKPKIGSEWILQCSTQKKRAKKIILNGREYQYIIESNDEFERTTIVEVEL